MENTEVKKYAEKFFVKYLYNNIDKVFKKLETLDKALDHIAEKQTQKATQLIVQSQLLATEAQDLAAQAQNVQNIKEKIKGVTPSQ